MNNEILIERNILQSHIQILIGAVKLPVIPFPYPTPVWTIITFCYELASIQFFIVVVNLLTMKAAL